MDEANILRNRTFNDELRYLVNKVSSHEKNQTKVPVNLKRKELILAFHKLFYEMKYLSEYNFSGSDFNPFLNTEETDFNSISYIVEYLKKSGYGDYAILEYQIENECFESSVTSFDEANSSSIVIGCSDNLFKNILTSDNGLLLKRDEIKADKFLSRKFFHLVEDGESSCLYFISFSLLTEKIQSYYNIKKLTAFFSPIIMLKFKEHINPSDLIKIRMDLEKNLSLPSFIYNDKTNVQLAWPSLQNLLYYVDYFNSLYSLSGTGIVYLLNTKKYNNREIILSMKYLYSRFYKTLSNESVIFRVSVNSIIIFTINSMIPALDKIMDEWNVIYDNAFKIEILTIQEMEKRDFILKDFFA